MGGRLNVVVAGVGGQGVITAAVLIATAALEAGYEALVAETHGLSQRGGTVVVHVRLGKEVEAPLVARGMADTLIALEPLEAARYSYYLRRGGILVANTYMVPPPIPGVSVPTLEELANALHSLRARVYLVDATRRALELGSARAANTYILGFALAVGAFHDMLELRHFEEAIRSFGRDVDVNLKALKSGYEEGLIAAEQGSRK
jgi:indolepyruvate ferredoxin oxidoreductase beta subunit